MTLRSIEVRINSWLIINSLSVHTSCRSAKTRAFHVEGMTSTDTYRHTYMELHSRCMLEQCSEEHHRPSLLPVIQMEKIRHWSQVISVRRAVLLAKRVPVSEWLVRTCTNCELCSLRHTMHDAVETEPWASTSLSGRTPDTAGTSVKYSLYVSLAVIKAEAWRSLFICAIARMQADVCMEVC